MYILYASLYCLMELLLYGTMGFEELKELWNVMWSIWPLYIFLTLTYDDYHCNELPITMTINWKYVNLQKKTVTRNTGNFKVKNLKTNMYEDKIIYIDEVSAWMEWAFIELLL